MLRALTRSIFGKNCGASFCSTSMQRTPRRPRSTASVSPVGPPPAMRTWVSMMILKSYNELRALPLPGGERVGVIGARLGEPTDNRIVFSDGEVAHRGNDAFGRRH